MKITDEMFQEKIKELKEKNIKTFNIIGFDRYTIDLDGKIEKKEYTYERVDPRFPKVEILTSKKKMITWNKAGIGGYQVRLLNGFKSGRFFMVSKLLVSSMFGVHYDEVESRIFVKDKNPLNVSIENISFKPYTGMKRKSYKKRTKIKKNLHKKK